MLANRYYSGKPGKKTLDQPYLPLSDKDEKSIILEMLSNNESPHWEQCLLFVKRRVYAQAHNIPQDDWDNIVQDVMVHVIKKLASFRFECAFRNWLYPIILNGIRDKYRVNQRHAPWNEEWYGNSSIYDENFEDENFRVMSGESVEEALIYKEYIRGGWDAIQEYAATHGKSVRNQYVLFYVILGGYTYIEAARKVGCDSTVAGYVVREAQSFAREKMHYPK